MILNKLNASLELILYDPLSYIHPERMYLPEQFDTPRKRGIVNDMLIRQLKLPVGLGFSTSAHERHLVLNWRRLAYISTLIGAQLLKSDLAWQGDLLHLPDSVRFFLTLQICNTAPSRRKARMTFQEVQRFGLQHLLLWQRHASEPLTKRMALLFPPTFDKFFLEQYSSTWTSAAVHLFSPSEYRSEHASEYASEVRQADLSLILQAIQYAKNNPNNV